MVRVYEPNLLHTPVSDRNPLTEQVVYLTYNSCPHPVRDTIMLLWPFPWKFALPRPISVEELLRNPDIIERRKSSEVNYTPLRQIKLFAIRDTPLRSLYRMYECLVTDNEDEMMQESQYWFHHQVGWHLANIPDPQDTDPVRYAILASLADALVHSFNHKIRLGLRRGITNNKPWLIQDFRQELNPPWEECPEWCSHVGPLEEPMELVPGVVKACDNPGPFVKRNIFANFVQLYNV